MNRKRGESEQKHWLVRPKTIRKLWIGGCVTLALTVAAQFFFPIKGHFGADGIFGFFAFYGFTSCIAMVVAAKVLGVLLKRKDTYYDRH